MDNILIIRLSSLGDIIHTLPAFAALRRTFPAARIRWVVERPGKDILDLVPGIDEIIVRGEKGWISRIRNKDQTAVDFQGLHKSAIIAFLSGSRRRLGFSRKNLREPSASFFYTESLEEFTETGHVIDKNLRLAEKAGSKTDGYEFPIALAEDLRRNVRRALAGLGRREGQKIILHNVGASWKNKRWPSDRWIRLLRLMNKGDFFHLLLWGNEFEKTIASHIAAETETPAVPFFTVPEVLALIAESALLISGDTFALQAACALGVPVIGLFGPTNPKRNGPFLARDRAFRFPIDCRPCYKRKRHVMDCLAGIKPEDVAASASELMEKDGP